MKKNLLVVDDYYCGSSIIDKGTMVCSSYIERFGINQGRAGHCSIQSSAFIYKDNKEKMLETSCFWNNSTFKLEIVGFKSGKDS